MNFLSVEIAARTQIGGYRTLSSVSIYEQPRRKLPRAPCGSEDSRDPDVVRSRSGRAPFLPSSSAALR